MVRVCIAQGVGNEQLAQRFDVTPVAVSLRAWSYITRENLDFNPDQFTV